MEAAALKVLDAILTEKAQKIAKAHQVEICSNYLKFQQVEGGHCKCPECSTVLQILGVIPSVISYGGLHEFPHSGSIYHYPELVVAETPNALSMAGLPANLFNGAAVERCACDSARNSDDLSSSRVSETICVCLLQHNPAVVLRIGNLLYNLCTRWAT